MSWSVRRRLVVLALVVVVCAAGSVAFVLHAQRRQAAVVADAPPVPTVAPSAVEQGPRIVFRSTLLGEGYGLVAMTPLTAPDSARALTDRACERVYAAADHLLCLAADRGVVTTYSASILDENLREVSPLPLSGIASRARLSKDGKLAATTTFVAGHDYAQTSFATQTLVTRVGGASYGNVEDFTLVHRGTVVRPVDRNVWGVTFGDDDDTFYATVAWGGRTWLSRGSLSRRTLSTVREDAECPSLSPDGRVVAYKKRQGRPAGQWRLATLDLASGRETLLAETRTVDDQVEWLDDTTVIYGLPRSGADAAVTDVWAVAADGSGSPSRLIEGAWSPAVVR